MAKVKLEKYKSNRDQFVSILRNVPITKLETVRSLVKDAAATVENQLPAGRLEVRVRFRRSDYKNAYGDNYKDGSEAFDVYVDTKALPSKLSMKKREEIAEMNREAIVDTLLYGSLSF